jgi:hypothetical protein
MTVAGRACNAARMTIRHPPPLLRDTDDDPQIDTPVIDIQDLRHQHARSGGTDSLPQLDLSRDDEKARQAIEKFERALREQPPG